jgi:two-component system invasion response regulator UvrY
MNGQGTKSTTTVLLVDDHAVVREGYRRLLERQGEIVVVGEAANAEEAYTLFCRLNPGIVVMDITLPGASGIDVMRRMLNRDPTTRVVIFSMHEDVIFAKRALEGGAFGYVTKASAPAELVGAIRKVAAGERYVSSSVAQTLVLRDMAAGRNPTDGLTAREFEILHLLAQGHSVRDIAQSLGLTPKTIANHQSNIKQKLGADTTIQLLKAAEELGFER